MKSFHIENIKSFVDSGEIEIRPITVVIGKNSSGKSSLIRFPLILKQSLDSNFIGPLIFSGDMVDYGSYADVLFNNEDDKSLKFTIALDSEKIQNLILEYADTAYDLDNISQYEHLFTRKKPVAIDVEIDLLKENNVREIKVKNFCLSIEGYKLKVERSDNGLFSINNTKIAGMAFKGIFPGISENLLRSNKIKADEDWQFKELFLSFCRLYYENVLSSTQYIGPFRMAPQREYRVSEGNFDGVGKDGSAAPHILALRWLSGDIEFIDSINDSLRNYLNVELDVKVTDANKFQILVTDLLTGRKSNLMDVGFGISQILPIVVQAYYCKESVDSWINTLQIRVIEQPEIHLHPEAQANLADLFIQGYKDNPDNRFLIETHSRNMVLRLRRRVVEGVLNPEDVVIYYVKGGDKPGDSSSVEKLEIDRYGEIENWPDYFFDQAYQDVIAMKAARNKIKPKEDDIEW